MFKINHCRVEVHRGALLFTVAFALTSLFPLHSYSQDALEEVVVTARKREENLQEIPLAVSAFTEADLEQRGITSLQDIADFTPGFDFAHSFGRSDFRPAIRGQSNILGSANAGVFLEGIIIQRGGPTVPLAALERVEVVKGPQSALYGRSTLSGAVNYVLKKPGDEFRGEISAEYGERDHVQVDLHGSAPLGENAGFAVTLSHYERSGEYDNRFPGTVSPGIYPFGAPASDDEVGGEESSSITAVMTLDPSERFSLTAHASYEESDDDQYAIGIHPATSNNCYRPSDGAQPAPPAGTPAAGALGIIGRDGNPSRGYFGSGYYCGRVDIDNVLVGDGNDTRLETSYFDDMGVETESMRLGLRASLDLTEAVSVTSVTGYNDVEISDRIDESFGAPDYFFAPFSRAGTLSGGEDAFDDFSQEVRLNLDASEASRYLLGFYYYKSDRIEHSSLSSARRNDARFTGMPSENTVKNEVDSWSVFGSMEYDFTSKVTVGAEFRYNEDDLEVRTEDERQLDASFSAFLPKATAKYQATDNFMAYATVAKGNKPGGFNDDAGLPEAEVPVEEENAWSYEIGFKSAWMDGRLLANVSAYHIDWKDQALTVTRDLSAVGGPRSTSIQENIGKSTIKGVELELVANPTDFWEARLAYALTDSEVDRYLQTTVAGAPASSGFREAALIFGYQDDGDVLISGTQLPLTSKHQLNLSSMFYGSMTNDWSWFLRGDFNYNSKRYAQVYNLAHTGNREIVNLRGGISNGGLSLEVWVNNLFDNEDPTSLIRYVDFSRFSRVIGTTLPEKRRVGVTARYRF